ncbi:MULTISPECIES: hypothetical protein [Pseudanabaena]|nr:MULTISPECIES: hypothetical protein [Pseudanabaena]MDG3496347.1 hypothetical protein [Pseudanabaena catenata USMAC16]
MPFRQFRAKIYRSLCLLCITLGIAIGLNACISPSNDKKTEEAKSPVPIFLFLQASPDGKTIEGIVPSDLVEQFGSLDRVIQSIPAGSKFSLMQFGKPLGTFQVSAVRGSDAFGAIASFKVKTPDNNDKNSNDNSNDKNQSGKSLTPEVLRQPNLTIVASDRINTTSDRNYFFNCPNKIQPLVLEKSRNLFVKLGASPAATSQVSIASLVCADINGDNQPEIITGLRLDNPLRPTGLSSQAWKEFLSLPAIQRQEYSMLVMLSKGANDDWISEPILTHTRALSYVNDSVSSYALYGIQEVNGDRYPEIIVQEIGLNSLDVRVFTPSLNAQGKWQWRSYYQNQRSLNIVQ